MKEKWHQIVMKAELFVIVMVKTQSSNIAKHRRNDDGCVPEIDFMRIMTSRTMLVIMTMMIETKKKTKSSTNNQEHSPITFQFEFPQSLGFLGQRSQNSLF